MFIQNEEKLICNTLLYIKYPLVLVANVNLISLKYLFKIQKLKTSNLVSFKFFFIKTSSYFFITIIYWKYSKLF